jgi:hypothetical protein
VAHRGLVFVLWQVMPSATSKRPRPSSPDAEPQPQLLALLALPEAVCEDHLLSLLTCKDAARLECTCRALRGGGTRALWK